MINQKQVVEKLLLLIATITILLITTAAAPTPERNYAEEIIAAVAVGDIDTARGLNNLRNAKIDDNPDCGYSKIDTDELWLISKIVHQEAGSDWLTDAHQQAVASVVLNRKNSPEFPDTVYEVVNQPGQYSGAGGSYFDSLIPSERAVRNAFIALECGGTLPATVVFQAEFVQGSAVCESYYSEISGNTTYFCHSGRMELYGEGAE